MSQFPMKGIKNPSPNNDFSYAHSVLQSLGCLDCAKLFYNFQIIILCEIIPNIL